MKKSRIKLVTIIVLAVVMLVSCNGKTGTMTDIDGNIYQTIQIGNQTWMAENLKVTHYRNGDAIQTGYSNSEWEDLYDTETGAYCVYDDQESNADTYGYLYNWVAVDDTRNIAPEGWHIPTDEEWQILVDFLGGSSVAGGKMKETGTVHWNSPNTGATNESGFTALPGGYRSYDYGNYNDMGNTGCFWSSTEYDSTNAWTRKLYYYSSEVPRYYYCKKHGISVRLVRD
ncbi:MAG: fibrobacter succinogenes major paralogous domain-containing protein [Candidatus Marinimicrobia bacterium]|nr:fibrobacter succinogenes major paralogous domain-containing protein [Candidatus Neomarinimicrobiota bacterium]MBL7023659.1 fibrobacter succinogenes major paralogous domain-containing protein [Candidatus Neomarinimicrobiota bacterium]MBL7109877.1 fibrobacter succinogenes major paralogous domain-containing protein [Candidatus Neomarinimicrobiota bacterium]